MIAGCLQSTRGPSLLINTLQFTIFRVILVINLKANVVNRLHPNDGDAHATCACKWTAEAGKLEIGKTRKWQLLPLRVLSIWLSGRCGFMRAVAGRPFMP